jgi:hypothetical protein
VPEKASAIFLKTGVLTPQGLNAAVALKQRDGGTLSEAILRLGLLDEEHLVSAFQKNMQIPRVSAAALARVSKDVLNAIPAELAAQLRIIPMDIDASGSLTLAMVDPSDDEAVEQVIMHTLSEVNRAVASPTAMREALRTHYGVVLNKPGGANAPAAAASPQTAPAAKTEPVVPAAAASAPASASTGASVTAPAPTTAAPAAKPAVAQTASPATKPAAAAPAPTKPAAQAAPSQAPMASAAPAKPAAAAVPAKAASAPAVASAPTAAKPAPQAAPQPAIASQTKPAIAQAAQAPIQAAAKPASPAGTTAPIPAKSTVAAPAAAPVKSTVPAVAPMAKPAAQSTPGLAPKPIATAPAAKPAHVAVKPIATAPQAAKVEPAGLKALARALDGLGGATAAAPSAGGFAAQIADMQQATQRDEVVAILLEAVKPVADQVALFVIQQKQFACLDGRGSNVDMLKWVQFSTEEPSPFNTVVASKEPFLGKLAATGENQMALATLGSSAGPLLMVPLMFKGRGIGVLYADELKKDLTPLLRDLAQLADEAATAFARIILLRKKSG